MRFRVSSTLVILLVAGCSGLEPLTEDALIRAQEQWDSSAPDFYRVLVEMTGERIESGVFEVLVREGQVVSLQRNGQVILPDRGQDYSVQGLFAMLRQELALAEQPTLLGAPPGYAAHLLARFDPATGRLERYRRTVAGVNNNIEIVVVEYEPQ